MSSASTQGLIKRKVRYIRDNAGRIIEIREFAFTAEIGSWCRKLIIKRDPITKRILSFYSEKDTVNQDDINYTEE